jgi:hypothetical protein
MEHEEIRPEVNPETGKQVYPWTDAQGNALNSNGSVVECDCERCLAKYEI